METVPRSCENIWCCRHLTRLENVPVFQWFCAHKCWIPVSKTILLLAIFSRLYLHNSTNQWLIINVESWWCVAFCDWTPHLYLINQRVKWSIQPDVMICKYNEGLVYEVFCVGVSFCPMQSVRLDSLVNKDDAGNFEFCPAWKQTVSRSQRSVCVRVAEKDWLLYSQ